MTFKKGHPFYGDISKPNYYHSGHVPWSKSQKNKGTMKAWNKKEVRICTRCHRTEKETEFASKRYRCRECHRKEAVEYHRKRDKRAVKDKRLRKIYGITIDQYDEMFKTQNGVCWICHRPPKKMPLHVDHDHKSGKVRGLLCHNCNYGIGRYFKDNIESLRRAVQYLEKEI